MVHYYEVYQYTHTFFQNWKDIGKRMMAKSEVGNLQRRIEKFDVATVKKNRLAKVELLLSSLEVSSVKSYSAVAAVFHQWVSGHWYIG